MVVDDRTIERGTKFSPEPTPDIWAQLIDLAERQAHDADDAEAAQLAAEAARDETQILRDETEGFKDTSVVESTNATTQATKAKNEAEKAELSENEALIAKIAAQQALTDLLAILGQPGGFATLDGSGKLTANQMPNIALIKVVDVMDVQSCSTLTPGTSATWRRSPSCRGDPENGTTYVLVDPNPSDIGSWRELQVGYSAFAGQADTAENASNADKVNGHRIVTF